MSNCISCSQTISEQYLMNVNGTEWHCTCLKCSVCGDRLEDKCFLVKNKYICENDFYRVHGKKCFTCKRVIKRSAFYQNIGGYFYHAECFQCSICQTVLTKGNTFIPTEKNTIICTSHMTVGNATAGKKRKLDTSADFFQNDNAEAEKILDDAFNASERPEKRRCPEESTNVSENIQEANEDLNSIDQQSQADPSTFLLTNNADDIELIDDNEPLPLSHRADSEPSETNNATPSNEPNATSATQAGGRRRGPRTTIKSHQLDRLKEVFAVTPKPPRTLREKLSVDTGLPMRVIQVWFQNRRSKERRIQQAQVNNSRRQWALRDNARRQFEMESNALMMNQNNHQVYVNGEGHPIMMPNEPQMQYLYAPNDNIMGTLPMPPNSQLPNGYNQFIPDHLMNLNGPPQTYPPDAQHQGVIYSHQPQQQPSNNFDPAQPPNPQQSMVILNSTHSINQPSANH